MRKRMKKKQQESSEHTLTLWNPLIRRFVLSVASHGNRTEYCPACVFGANQDDWLLRC